MRQIVYQNAVSVSHSTIYMRVWKDGLAFICCQLSFSIGKLLNSFYWRKQAFNKVFVHL